MIIKCLAIDDEPLALKQLASYIEKISYFELVGTCQSANEAKRLLNKEKIDAIFIDINMPDMTGLDFVKSLAAPPLVVFTTAYSEYAIDGYKVDAVDYLLKPFGLDEFKAAAGKVKKQFYLIDTVAAHKADADDSMFLKTDYKVVRIKIHDICYIESMSEYLRIFLEGQHSPIMVLMSMKKMEERLPERMFMRIHRGSIINLKKIKEVSRNHIILENGANLPIGDLYKERFNAYINSKFLAK